MASIDPYLKLALERNAKSLVLSPNDKPYFIFDGGKKPLGQALSADQINSAILEILPADMKQEFSISGEVAWEHDYMSNTFRISTRKVKLGVEVVFVSPGTVGLAQSSPANTNSNAGLANTKSKSGGIKQTSIMKERLDDYAKKFSGMESDRAIDRFLFKMLEIGASDVHLCSTLQPMYRVDGELNKDSMGEVLDPQFLVDMLFQIAPPDSFDDFQDSGNCDFAYEMGDLARFRVNIFKEYRGISAAFRLIPQIVPSAEKLGLPKVVKMLASIPKGLVLVTGPTGSGKSTNLAAILDLVNRTRCDHIITIEEPIEFIHHNKKSLVHQREVGTHTIGFQDALRSALREDPDVVLIGEMRDLETISTAIETAATGHLVFGTLHTTSAINTIDRIIDMFPTDAQSQVRTMLSDSLVAVISQVLLKRNGGGRVAAQEILVVNHSVAAMIREQKTHMILSNIQTGRSVGMQLMNEEIAKLVKKNIVTPLDAYMKAFDKVDLIRTFDNLGINFSPPSDLLALAGTFEGDEEEKENQEEERAAN